MFVPCSKALKRNCLDGCESFQNLPLTVPVYNLGSVNIQPVPCTVLQDMEITGKSEFLLYCGCLYLYSEEHPTNS